MRNRLMTVTAALLLASATVATAQDKKAAATEEKTSIGYVDLGFRGTSSSGDFARYERYRDLRTGANVNLGFGQTTDKSSWSLTGSNLGYNDQSAAFSFQNKMFKFTAFFDQTPLNYGLKGMTTTPWTQTAPDTWTLDSASRAAVEAKTAVGVLCAPGLAAVGTCNGLTAPTVLTYPSIYRNTARAFDIQTKRTTFGFGLGFAITKDIDVDAYFQSSGKKGNQPFGLAFAFNNANELPISLDNRTNDFGVGMQWGSDKGMIRVAYDRSVFTQNIASVTWDNPIRMTDWNDGQAIDMTGNGPWDPSAYSNGNGPAKGRLAMPPSNTLDFFSATGLAKLPGHATLNASIAFSSNKQNDALIPWTINPVIANAATYAFFPGLAALPRTTAQARVDGLNANVNFNMRPAPWFNLAARYRYADRKDRTPAFASDSTVRFDGVPEQGIVAPGAYSTEEWNSSYSTFSADATFTPIAFTALRIGVGSNTFSHSNRAYASLTDNSVKVSLDTTGNQFVQFRAQMERIRRTGNGFNEEHITEPGGQAASRMFDDAERTRDRGTLLVTISPASFLDLSVSWATGKDVYDEGEQQFGLLDNKNTSTNFGVTVTPVKTIAFGVNYGQDKFDAFQRSRTANPFSGVPGAYESWNDPARDWAVSNNETVKNLDVFADFIDTIKNTEFRFNFVSSNSNNGFVHSGPRIDIMKTNGIGASGDARPCTTGLSSCFEALPNVTNKWTRFNADFRLNVSKKFTVGATYSYEKLDVVDFATINLPGTSTPRIDYLGALSTGYGNRPYKGSTFYARVLYHF